MDGEVFGQAYEIDGSGEIDGSIQEDGTVAGTVTIDVDGEVVVEDFTANFSGDNISGTFEGSMPYTYESYELQLDYVGTFTADR
jgi:hypothetical protein